MLKFRASSWSSVLFALLKEQKCDASDTMLNAYSKFSFAIKGSPSESSAKCIETFRLGSLWCLFQFRANRILIGRCYEYFVPNLICLDFQNLGRRFLARMIFTWKKEVRLSSTVRWLTAPALLPTYIGIKERKWSTIRRKKESRSHFQIWKIMPYQHYWSR